MSQRRVKSTPRSVKAQSKQVAPLRMPVKGQPKAVATAAPVVPPTSQMMNIEFGPDDPFASIRYNRNTKLENQKLALHLLDATEAVSHHSFSSKMLTCIRLSRPVIWTLNRKTTFVPYGPFSTMRKRRMPARWARAKPLNLMRPSFIWLLL